MCMHTWECCSRQLVWRTCLPWEAWQSHLLREATHGTARQWKWRDRMWSFRWRQLQWQDHRLGYGCHHRKSPNIKKKQKKIRQLVFCWCARFNLTEKFVAVAISRKKIAAICICAFPTGNGSMRPDVKFSLSLLKRYTQTDVFHRNINGYKDEEILEHISWVLYTVCWNRL